MFYIIVNKCIQERKIQILDHLMSAKLDPAVNMWSSVFDFTPLADDDNYQLQNTPKLCNWRLLAVEDRLKDRFTETELLHCTKYGSFHHHSFV